MSGARGHGDRVPAQPGRLGANSYSGYTRIAVAELSDAEIHASAAPIHSDCAAAGLRRRIGDITEGQRSITVSGRREQSDPTGIRRGRPGTIAGAPPDGGGELAGDIRENNRIRCCGVAARRRPTSLGLQREVDTHVRRVQRDPIVARQIAVGPRAQHERAGRKAADRIDPASVDPADHPGVVAVHDLRLGAFHNWKAGGVVRDYARDSPRRLAPRLDSYTLRPGLARIGRGDVGFPRSDTSNDARTRYRNHSCVRRLPGGLSRDLLGPAVR